MEERLKAMFHLENAVLAVAYMCSIAAKLCHEEFSDVTGDESRDDDRNKALFAVNHAHDLAEKLRTEYLKAFEVPDAASD